MATIAKDIATDLARDNVDYRLLNRLSNLVICSSCLRRGKVTPVPQVISDRHSLTNVCPDCRHRDAVAAGFSKSIKSLGNLFKLPI